MKDRDALLAFYDFPAEHWRHLRTTNPIESTFATIRHRTVRAKGCLSNKTALALIFKLAQAAEKSWRRLDGHRRLPKVIRGITFPDGIEVVSRDLNPLPPDPARHQLSAIARPPAEATSPDPRWRRASSRTGEPSCRNLCAECRRFRTGLLHVKPLLRPWCRRLCRNF